MPHIPEIVTLGDILRYHARRRPSARALVFERRASTFADLDRHASQVANALQAEGLKPGQRIAFLGKNSDFYFELLFGAAKAGLVLVPINWRLAPPEIAYILRDSCAQMIFVAEEFRQAIGAGGKMPFEPRRVLSLEALDGYQAWRDRASPNDPCNAIAPMDVVLQLYTSGTTGHPKGVQLSHANNLAQYRDGGIVVKGWNDADENDVSLNVSPIFHIAGTGSTIRSLYTGTVTILLAEFDAEKTIEAITEHRVTRMFLVPSAIHAVLRVPRARTADYSCLRYVSYGASPIPLDLLREALDVFKCGFLQLYGMTETTGAVTALPPEDHDPAGTPRMRSAGKPLPGTEVKIIDGDGNPVPVGRVGEVCIRSASNMVGYWNLADATAKTLEADGFLRTGDAGYLDADGYVYIHDRVKDMIISGAENIYPAEVESAIFGHPAVADVAVIGVPSERWGEEVKAIVVKKPGIHVTPEEIIAFARTRIAGFKVPKSVSFVESLPRNPSGKLLKRELRKPYWEGRERQVN